MTERDQRLPDDETLSAWLDGELTDERADELRARLDREPELAARLAQLEHTDERVRAAYAGVLDEPLPQSVLDLLAPASEHGAATRGSGHGAGDAVDATRGSDHSAGDAGGADVIALRPRDPRRWLTLPVAAAAGIALAVGVLVGHLAGPGPGPALVAGIVEPGTTLHGVLQSAPSAETRALGPNFAATPRLTFRTAGGDYCRQIDVAVPGGTTETLGCRRGGRWQVELTAFAAAAADGAFRPAAGDSTPVRAAVDALLDGAPLDAEAERALIANGWTAPPRAP